VGAAPELSTTFALTLLSGNACGSYDGRPHADRADLRRRGTCARRSPHLALRADLVAAVFISDDFAFAFLMPTVSVSIPIGRYRTSER